MRNKIFIGVFFIIVIIFSTTFLYTEQKEVSFKENRALKTVPAFSTESYFDGSFQDDFEQALSDQIVFADDYKTFFNSIKKQATFISVQAFNHFMEAKNSQSLAKDNTIFDATFIPLGMDIFQIKDSGHLVVFAYEKDKYDEIIRSKIRHIAKEVHKDAINKDVAYYLYYIEGVRDIDLKNNKITHQYRDILREEFAKIGKSCFFEINNSADFKERYYKSDHHWNHIGQKIGYHDIITMLLGEDEKRLDLTSKKIDNIKFVGSRARKLDDWSIYDDFYINVAEIPAYDYYINGVKSNKRFEVYANSPANIDPLAYHYSTCHDADESEIMYDFDDDAKDNLLIIGDSYSNSVNRMVASHFNKTYVVDLRAYQKDVAEDFKLDVYIKEHDIDKVLFLCSAGMIIRDDFNIGGNK